MEIIAMQQCNITHHCCILAAASHKKRAKISSIAVINCYHTVAILVCILHPPDLL